jgi:hypothetical protein
MAARQNCCIPAISKAASLAQRYSTPSSTALATVPAPLLQPATLLAMLMISTLLSALALTSCVPPGADFGLGLIDRRALPLRALGLQSSAPPVTGDA